MYCALVAGSSALGVQPGWGSEDGQAKQIKLGPAIHGAFNQLQTVDETLAWPGMPRQGEGQVNRWLLMHKRSHKG